jgi:hypothetical protein
LPDFWATASVVVANQPRVSGSAGEIAVGELFEDRALYRQ